ncbi:hypothetical protein [Pseudobacteroides cellulosolvens]|uniref:Glycosyltransferase RgtA/B/C/D-like domain-containing protein n=1 Tax=Pseudobacteroides cellulosolvens ATCC 35603 = DSM 2933 TaxID=398512 RepID=A0A0L6JUQ1_9FIRM|nr:hypothetical protein [Pseudobacteroides cellulosolvens]KNY29375.1 hypothetical protein Bccel_4649 [Pseudobacteroides cellulosolvens ATCC 35603 = DSM 2933]
MMSLLKDLFSDYNYIKICFLLAFLVALVLSLKAYIFEFLESMGVVEKSERVSLLRRIGIINKFGSRLGRIAQWVRETKFIKDLCIILLMVVATRLIMFLMAFMGWMITKDESIGFWSSMEMMWNRWDGGHYLYMAEHWYTNDMSTDKRFHLVFYPLYPVLIKGVYFFVRNYFWSAMIVSNVSLFVGATYLYKLVKLDHEEAFAFRAVKYMLIYPITFFLSINFSESVFFTLSIMTVYYLRRHKWFLMGLCGMFAAVSRNFGIILLVPVVAEFLLYIGNAYKNKNDGHFVKRMLNGLNILFLPAGFSLYLLLNKVISGDWFTFLRYQKEYWSQSFGMFYDNIKSTFVNAIPGVSTWGAADRISLWVPQAFSIALVFVLVIYGIRKIRNSYSLYMLAYITIALSPTWLLSGSRYLMCIFPMFVIFAWLSRKRIWDFVLTYASIILLAYYAFSFSCGFGRMM